ncbi:Imm26 family immunity protein [Flavobacterium ginsengiterrae]|uniref:Immunity protein 26 of polymorphic toxin system n=1 Tax=Flavobacterium ginsengiterrae TaxID=871695 RepID=A0ABP7GSM6_9FLAO
MYKIEPGLIIEISLPDGRLAYGLKLDSVIIGIYKIMSSKKLQISDIIQNQVEIYIAIDDTYLKKRPFTIIGEIDLINEEIYPPDLAWYAEWSPDDSVKTRAIRNKRGQHEYTNKEYYISLVKKGLVLSVFNKPEPLTFWIMDNILNWPNYKMPSE